MRSPAEQEAQVEMKENGKNGDSAVWRGRQYCALCVNFAHEMQRIQIQ